MSKNIERRLELISKLIEIGNSLMIEGDEDKDLVISQTGTFIILVAGLMFDEDDVHTFGQLCSMFSAKKLLEGLSEEQSDMLGLIKNRPDDESYEDFIKRLNKLRGEDDDDDKNY